MIDYFVVMTVQGVVDGNLRAKTLTATGVFDQEKILGTRAQIFSWMKQQFSPELADLPVVFFYAEPDAVPPRRTDKPERPWPKGVIARYLTVAGATVDITDEAGSRAHWHCTACPGTSIGAYTGPWGDPVPP